MAHIKLDWTRFHRGVQALQNWRAFTSGLEDEVAAELISDHAVYVIRISRPYSFLYPKSHSPVVYIGKGQVQKRLTSHLKKWLLRLSQDLHDLEIEVCVCSPRARWHGQLCEEVEADLLFRFEKEFGSVPVRNLRMEYAKYSHIYDTKELSILKPGSGKGYIWGLTPLRASSLYKSK